MLTSRRVLLPLHRHSTLRSCQHLRQLSDDRKTVRIGCGSGFWGDTPTAPAQLITKGKLDYLIFDYLSELTMSLLTAAKQKKPELGYAPDFLLYAMAPHLKLIKDQGIKVVTNAGGINTSSCVAALKQLCAKSGVDLKIAEVQGDNMWPLREQLMSSGEVKEMYSGMDFPKTAHSMTAYFGAGPIVRALEMGADIVVTGRTADSALALAPLVHEFGWKDFDRLAAGSLAGHLIECGGQASGGLFTDWAEVEGYDKLGFPIVEMAESGEMLVSKAPGTGGLVSPATVGEQMLYEIGDTRNYILPDVICDFSAVQMDRVDEDVVRVRGAKGKPPTNSYKVSATYMDGYKATGASIVAGLRAADKGRTTAEAIMKRTRELFKAKGLPDFDRTHVQMIGAEESYGANANPVSPREAVIWMSVQHKKKEALELWAREIASSGTGMTPGLTGMIGGRPKASPCLKLFSFLYPKERLPATIVMDEVSELYEAPVTAKDDFRVFEEAPPAERLVEGLKTGEHTYTLEELAYARSGDKGDSCNIGVIARHPGYLPYIKNAVTSDVVAEYFKHMFEHPTKEPKELVKRYNVDGINGVNFLLENSLGGGGICSLRPDPLGKAMAQILLSMKLSGLPSLEEMKKN